MITFKSIEYKNFLSTGNAANKVQLDKAPMTLIIGKNGQGKSLILDVITFCLFNKPFRNITKPQLVNSINGKNLLTTIEFETHGDVYIIHRGIKPNIFEIYKNGTLITQDANVKDYQVTLERQILRMNYRSFTQVVILGSASFVPFMQLSAALRRDVIEDILDIKVFGQMNALLKDKTQQTKEAITQTNNKLVNLQTDISAHERVISTLTENKNNHEKRILIQIDELCATLAETELVITEKETTRLRLIDEISDIKTNKTEVQQYTNKIKSLIYTNEEIKKSQAFFNDNDSCPSCEQNITHSHKTHITAQLKTKFDLLHTEIVETNNSLSKCKKRAGEITETEKQTISLYYDIKQLKNDNITLANRVNNLRKEYTDLLSNNIDVKKENDGLSDKKIDYQDTQIDKIELQKIKDVEEACGLLLKDSGIKTTIVNKYLPIMNSLINKYLEIMDFFVSFTLDDSFNETIKSRHRDSFSYASFSEGEKMKIDLALLFSWREIAKMKNSTNTNLLILDEILSSALDTQSNEYIMQLLKKFSTECNVLVISHNVENIIERFDRVIEAEKHGDFSVLVDKTF